MIQRRIISSILLCLLFLINWHNTFFHSHQKSAKGETLLVHTHDHHDHHHHGERKLALWDWLHLLLDHFEHPDLGEKHFEVFLHPAGQIGLQQPTTVIFQPFAFHLEDLRSIAVEKHQHNKPNKVLSFADPPFLKALSTRGPPKFS